MIIFFAFTGTLQVFKLHEAYRDTPGSQGDWIAWFAQFHKEQAWIPPRVAFARRVPPEPPTAAKDGTEAKSAKPMKWFVALMGVTLATTTLLGLYIAFNYPRRRRGFLVALILGLLIPIALMAV